jgi:diaminopropionate ammonia-lyase
LVAGKPVAVTGGDESIMAGLACGEVSMVAWDVLKHGADFMMTLDEDAAPKTMRYLAEPGTDDRPIVGGESGVAGLAGLIATASDAKARRQLGLGPSSIVLIIGSEGATDAVTYHDIVGRTPEEVIGQ